VRGYVKNPNAELPPKTMENSCRGVIGKECFTLSANPGYEMGLYREPYVGSVPIVSGEIAEDFAYYLAKSEQIPSAVLLGVCSKNKNRSSGFGRRMIQMMPGANEHIITMIEDTIATRRTSRASSRRRDAQRL
jgi:molecular chaperone Hsp33